jgi:hypothetical protein
MDQVQRGRKIKMLWALILIGIAYGCLLYYQRKITGTDFADGIIGVLLGLYICSHPAANLVDMLFYSRGGRRQFPSKWSALLWLALNMMVLLTGCLSIFIGTTRIVGRAE